MALLRCRLGFSCLHVLCRQDSFLVLSPVTFPILVTPMLLWPRLSSPSSIGAFPLALHPHVGSSPVVTHARFMWLYLILWMLVPSHFFISVIIPRTHNISQYLLLLKKLILQVSAPKPHQASLRLHLLGCVPGNPPCWEGLCHELGGAVLLCWVLYSCQVFSHLN